MSTARTERLHNVTFLDVSSGLVRCNECGGWWTVNYLPGGGRLPRRWWLCPWNGCNDPR